MANQQVIISVLADVKKFSAGMRGISGAFKKFGRAAVAATAVVGAALAKVGYDALKAAEESETATKRLDSIAESMKLFGKEAGAVSKRLQEYASAQQFATGVDDETIMATQAKLLTFKELAKSADTMGGMFDRATQAAIDLAAAGFGSATSNAVQLGKALNDPVKGINSLTRAGITFTEKEKKKIKRLVESGKLLEAQNVVMGAIEKQVGGTAEATVKATDQIAIAWGEVSETIGKVLLPYIKDMAETIVKWLNSDDGKAFFENLVKYVQGFIDFWKSIWEDPKVQKGVKAIYGKVQDFMDYINSPQGRKDIAAWRDFLVQVFEDILKVVNFLIDALKILFGWLANVIKAWKKANKQAENYNSRFYFPNAPETPSAPSTSPGARFNPSPGATYGASKGITVNVTGLTPTATIGRTILSAVTEAQRLGVR